MKLLKNTGFGNSPPATSFVTGSQNDTDQLFITLFTEV